jgi:hypothetical protein
MQSRRPFQLLGALFQRSDSLQPGISHLKLQAKHKSNVYP